MVGGRPGALIDWCCRNGALVLSAAVAVYLLHAAELEFGPHLVQMLAQESAILGIVTVGALLVFHAGGFDLSMGAIFALALVALAMLSEAGHTASAVVVVLAGGLLAGAINGVLGVALRAPVLVSAALAVGWREAAMALAGSHAPASLSAPLQPYRALSWQTLGGLSLSFLIFVVAAVVLGWMFSHTAVGRRITAAGLSERHAAMAGVHVPLYRVACYAVGGMAAALGALTYFSLLSSGNPQVGEMLPFDALAAIVIGNGGLHRGRPAPLRVAVAVVCLTALHAGASAVMQSPRSALLVMLLLVCAALLGQWRQPAAA